MTLSSKITTTLFCFTSCFFAFILCEPRPPLPTYPLHGRLFELACGGGGLGADDEGDSCSACAVRPLEPPPAVVVVADRADANDDALELATLSPPPPPVGLHGGREGLPTGVTNEEVAADPGGLSPSPPPPSPRTSEAGTRIGAGRDGEEEEEEEGVAASPPPLAFARLESERTAALRAAVIGDVAEAVESEGEGGGRPETLGGGGSGLVSEPGALSAAAAASPPPVSALSAAAAAVEASVIAVRLNEDMAAAIALDAREGDEGIGAAVAAVAASLGAAAAAAASAVEEALQAAAGEELDASSSPPAGFASSAAGAAAATASPSFGGTAAAAAAVVVEASSTSPAVPPPPPPPPPPPTAAPPPVPKNSRRLSLLSSAPPFAFEAAAAPSSHVLAVPIASVASILGSFSGLRLGKREKQVSSQFPRKPRSNGLDDLLPPLLPLPLPFPRKCSYVVVFVEASTAWKPERPPTNQNPKKQ